MSDAWYEAVDASTRLTQGDLIFNCPLLVWKPGAVSLETSRGAEVLRSAMEAATADVIVITQACDLEHDKVADVILCPHYSLAEYRESWDQMLRSQNQNPSEKAWRRHCEDIRDGFVWNLAMLNEGVAGQQRMDHRVVDFHHVYTIPRTFLESIVQRRAEPRVRLRPPYREHLSQAYARFFMRVGLPTPVRVVW